MKNFEASFAAMPNEAFFSAPWVNSWSEAPFVIIEGNNVKGVASAFVGHKMSLTDDLRPRGLWGEWQWNQGSLTAKVDPMAYFTLFFYEKDGVIGVSPSILQLLANNANTEPDHVALAVFHRVGFFGGSDTPFRFIRTLKPGEILTWCNGKSRIQSLAPAPRTLDISRKQAVEAFIELPRAAIHRFLAEWRGPIELPLSGGRDLRHILLEMAHQGRLPNTCVTFHHGGRALNGEVLAARAVAQRAGVSHTILGFPRLRLRDAVRGLLITQLCADEHAQMLPMHDYFSGKSSAVIDGIGGDILTNPDDLAAGFLKLAQKGNWEGIARTLAIGHGRVISKPEHNGGAGSVFSPDLDDAAIDRIAQTISNYSQWPDPYQAFWFFNRTRREISFTATGILGGSAMVFCPYLDPDFIDLGLSLPWSVTCDQKLHDDAICRAFPDYADIPFSNSFRSQPLPSMRGYRIANALDILRIAAVVGSSGSIAGIYAALSALPLLRAKADIYRIHNEFITGMSATEARRLIELGERLSKAASKGEKVVSQVQPSH